MTMRDYSAEIRWLRKFGRVAGWLRVADLFSDSIVGASKVVGSRNAEILEGLAKMAGAKKVTFWAVKSALGAECIISSLVTCMWNNSPVIAETSWGEHEMVWRNVHGVPVACDREDRWGQCYSPEPAAAILRRARASASSWTFGLDDGKVVLVNTPPVRATMSDTARAIVDRTRSFDSARAWLLWGPPGSGKTRAAHAIVDALCSSKVVMAGGVASHSEAWDAVEILRPDGLIVDDLDSVTSHDDLLARYDRAHDWAKVIVSTANLLDHMRGALVRPGRAADEDPVEIREPDPAIANSIAPDIAADRRTCGLLACYLAELQSRHRAGVLVDEDFAEMHRRMTDLGDR